MPEPITKEHHLRDFEERWCDDGYEFIGAGEAAGWRAISGWGVDGWDLGDWPYVVILFRDRIVKPSTLDNDPAVVIYERATYCEGDIDIERYATSEARQEATDETAMFYWKANDEPWIARPPADLKGPYRMRHTA